MGNRRMAQRMAKRAGLQEEGVAVSFGFTSLMAAILVGFLAELPYVGLLATLATFGVHRIVLVTDRQVYIFRDKPFHRPGEVLGSYPVASDSLTRKNGKLTFADGQEVWHSPLFAGRARRIENAVSGEQAALAGAAAANAAANE